MQILSSSRGEGTPYDGYTPPSTSKHETYFISYEPNTSNFHMQGPSPSTQFHFQSVTENALI